MNDHDYHDDHGTMTDDEDDDDTMDFEVHILLDDSDDHHPESMILMMVVKNAESIQICVELFLPKNTTCET